MLVSNIFDFMLATKLTNICSVLNSVTSIYLPRSVSRGQHLKIETDHYNADIWL